MVAPAPGSRGALAALSGLLVGVALLLAPTLAGAQSSRSFDVGMVLPTLDPYSMIAVDRAMTPQRFEFGFGAQFGWAKAPLSPTLLDNGQDSRKNLIEQQFTVDLSFFLGLADFLSLAASVPVAFNIYDTAYVGDPLVPRPAMMGNGTLSPTGIYQGQGRQNIGLSSAGPRDPRLAIKAQFFRNRFVEVGTIQEVTIPLGNSASYMGEKNVTYRPRLLLGAMVSRVNLALSFGGIVRERAELRDPAQPPAPQANALRFAVDHELTWGAGLGVRAHRVLNIGVESFGTIPIAGEETSPTVNLLGSISFKPLEKWRFIVAGGAGLLPSSPRNAEARVLAGFAFSLLPRATGLN